MRTLIKRIYLYLEAWFNLSFSPAWNPLYHLGQLTFFFFWIILVSGIYIFIFFDVTMASAYQSLEKLTHEQWYIGGVMRSLHRYASDAAVITILLHMFREFSLDRYRGFRWFSWFTGVPTLWILIALGISGYWLVWDTLAQYIAIGSSDLIDALPVFTTTMSKNFLEGNLSDRFFILLAFLHLLAFPVILIFALWIHVKRLTKVEISAPRGLAIGSFIGLLALSLIKPAESHAPANLSISPDVLHLDWFYLNVYPLLNYLSGGETWIVTTGITILLMLMPWLPPKRVPPPAVVSLDNCNGCGQCFDDCPFDAISMQARTDGSRWEKEPIVISELCAACGICVGSCPYSNPARSSDKPLITGIDLQDQPVQQLRSIVDKTLAESPKILVYSCSHSVDLSDFEMCDVQVIQLPCTGMIPASFINYALKKGARGVFILGCRSSDCYYRFGKKWLEQRLEGKRFPQLKGGIEQEKIEVFGAAETDKERVLKALDYFCKAFPLKWSNS